MSLPAAVSPLMAAAMLGIMLTTTHRWMPPVQAARAVAVTLGVIVAAAIPTAWIVAVGYVSHLAFLGGRLEWCANAVGIHDPVPVWIGLPTLLLSFVGVGRARRVARRYRLLRQHETGGVEIAAHSQPFAFTLPGRGGQVVVSTGLLSMLDDAERDVVLAHESAHADHRHDRYLLAAQLSAALVPPLRPLAKRLQFSLERWADEVAVTQCGDREFVAHTLAKVALRNVTPQGAMSFAGLGVPARVAALLQPPPGALRPGSCALLWTTIAVTSAFAVIQLHHLVQLLTALCSS